MITAEQLQEWRKQSSARIVSSWGEGKFPHDAITLQAYMDFSKRALPALLDEVARLNARVAHLESLINREFENCPWCGKDYWEKHFDCPAFTPEGDVK